MQRYSGPQYTRNSNNRQERPPRKFLNDNLRSTTSPQELLDLMDKFWDEFNVINFSTALHQLGKHHHKLFSDLSSTKNKEHISNQLTYMKEKIQNEDYLESLWDKFYFFLNKFESRHLPCIAGFIVRFELTDPKSLKIMETIAKLALNSNFEKFTPQTLCSLAWAYNKLALKDKYSSELISQIVKHTILINFEGFSPQHISIIANAYTSVNTAHIHETHRNNLEQFAKQALLIGCSKFHAEEINRLVLSLGIAYVKTTTTQHLFEEIALHLYQIRFKDFRIQGLGKLSWSYFVLNFDSIITREFLLNIIENGIKLFGYEKPTLRDLSSFAESCLGIPNLQKARLLADRIFKEVSSYNLDNNCEDMVAFMLTIAKLSLFDPTELQLFYKITNVLLKNKIKLEPKHACYVLRSLAMSGLQESIIFELAISIANDACGNNFSKFNIQDLCNFAWSLAILNIQDKKILQALINAIALKNDLTLVDNQLQLHTLLLHCEISKIEIEWDRKILDNLNLSLEKHAEKQIDSSGTHISVLNKVTERVAKIPSLKLVNEHFESGFFIDIAIFDNTTMPPTKYALEIMGPHHFSTCDHLLGIGIFKKRVLDTKGWKQVDILATEWRQMRNNDLAENTFLDQLPIPWRSASKPKVIISNSKLNPNAKVFEPTFTDTPSNLVDSPIPALRRNELQQNILIPIMTTTPPLIAPQSDNKSSNRQRFT